MSMIVFVGPFKIISHKLEEVPALIEVARALIPVDSVDPVPLTAKKAPPRTHLRHRKPSPALAATSVPASWETFLGRVKGDLRRILEYLLANPGCTRKDIVRDLGINQRTISGNMNAIWRYGTPLGILKEEVVVVEKVGTGRETAFHYHPGLQLKAKGLTCTSEY
jgi:hypothetical protein